MTQSKAKLMAVSPQVPTFPGILHAEHGPFRLACPNTLKEINL